MPADTQSGFTIIELMITIAVIAILAAVAVPSFSDALERNRIKGAAESVKAEFQYARSEAIKQSCEDGTILTFTAGATWQLSLVRCDASTKVTDSADFAPGVTLSNITFSDDNVAFNSRRGGSDGIGSITLSTTNYNLQVRIVSNRIVDICYPAGSKAMAGFGACS